MRACLLLSFSLCLVAGSLWALEGEDLIECKISLPNGALYVRGETNPVKDLVVNLTLTNRSARENLGKESVTVKRTGFITPEERKQLEELQIEAADANDYKQKLDEKMKQFVDGKTKTETIEVTPVNPRSFGVAYLKPVLGPHNIVEFVITRQPGEGEAQPAEGEKPEVVERDMPVEYTDRQDMVPTEYLAAGETTPEYPLPVGKFYKIRKPGTYTVKAIYRFIGDTSTEPKVVVSNEETFTVVPFKQVDRKIFHMTEMWEDFERGYPDFDYMVYQLKRAAPWTEIYYVQRIRYNGKEKFEWHRLCTVKEGTQPQVALVNNRKIAVLARHAKGDAALYTLDFTREDPVVTCEKKPVNEDGSFGTLRAEGGNVSVE